ncbi:MAG: hypothetical protein AMXMBFR66_34100 [Pseudomonadota bacterium]|nr:DUF1330 domain-containing protein [Rubrivivax sp.]NLZ42670.1 DUF1330 domain-containing protein [Comamonadaceae bacterium]
MPAPASPITTTRVSDPERDRACMAAAAVQAARGEHRVRGSRHETPEVGGLPHRPAPLRFPGRKATGSFAPGEYARKARPLRAGATGYFDRVLGEGVAAAPVRTAFTSQERKRT